MKLAILIPTYNEAKNIEGVIRAVTKYVPTADVHIIDDNSPDGTAMVVEGLMREFPQIKLKKRAGKLGLASAYLGTIMDLLRTGSYDLFLTMDADFSHHPKYILEMLKKIETNDVVIGSRYTKGGGIRNWPFRRLFLSYFGNLYARTILHTPFRDMTAGFIMMRGDFLKRVDLKKINATGYAFLMELKFYLYQRGARVAEVPIIFTDRTQGDSKISSNIMKEGLVIPWKMTFSRKYYRS